MRKLLVVVTVLFMTPIASGVTAELSYTETSVELNVVGATYGPYLAIVIDAPGVLSNFAKGPEAPSVAGSFGPATINGASGEVWGFGVATGEPYEDGIWLTADWATSTLVHVYAYETFDGGTTWLFRDQIPWIPEPMTITLLGLGGLFILRRRRHK